MVLPYLGKTSLGVLPSWYVAYGPSAGIIVVVVVVVHNKVRHSYIWRTVVPRITKFYRNLHTRLSTNTPDMMSLSTYGWQLSKFKHDKKSPQIVGLRPPMCLQIFYLVNFIANQLNILMHLQLL